MSPSTESTSMDRVGARDGLQSSTKHRLDALPAELLELIVLLVQEQDERLEIVAHALFSPDSSTRMRGNGLDALSSTCRRLRDSALPFMCEVVRSRHLMHPLCQLGALPPTLLSGVRKVNCSTIKRETLASLVTGLNMLPNLEAIDNSNDTMVSLTRPRSSAAVAGSGAANELADVPSEVIKNVFRRCRSRWRTVMYSDGSEIDLEQALELVCDPAKLERLELERFELFEPALRNSTQPAGLGHLFRYHHLTSLSIDIFNDDLLNTADVPKFVRLPALRWLEIGTCAQAILPFAQQMAPNVVDLRISFGASRLETQPAAVHLPHLRHLTVEMLWPAADLLHAFAKCDILSLRWIEGVDDVGAYVDEAETPTALAVPVVDGLPASLRTVTFKPDDVVQNRWSDDDIVALATKCAYRGIVFKVEPGSRVRTGHRAFTEMPRDWPHNATEVCEKKGASLRDLLDWATRRVHWLEQTGDVAGMRDMIELLTDLKQRQVIEEA